MFFRVKILKSCVEAVGGCCALWRNENLKFELAMRNLDSWTLYQIKTRMLYMCSQVQKLVPCFSKLLFTKEQIFLIFLLFK